MIILIIYKNLYTGQEIHESVHGRSAESVWVKIKGLRYKCAILAEVLDEAEDFDEILLVQIRNFSKKLRQPQQML